MLEGKINAALRYLTAKKKHPEPAKIYKDAILTEPTQKILSSYFDKIDENLI